MDGGVRGPNLEPGARRAERTAPAPGAGAEAGPGAASLAHAEAAGESAARAR